MLEVIIVFGTAFAFGMWTSNAILRWWSKRSTAEERAAEDALRKRDRERAQLRRQLNDHPCQCGVPGDGMAFARDHGGFFLRCLCGRKYRTAGREP